MNSLPVESLGVPARGRQTPRILSVPEYKTSSGPDVSELCAQVGLFLDPWQQLCLEYGLAERGDGRWAAFEVGVGVARQNGKGELLMAREIGGLFLLDEQLILHTAHQFNTAAEAFIRIVTLIENCDMLRRRVKIIRKGAGQESIELIGGARLRFLARSAASGRGFTGDLVILDEAQILDEAPMRAILPTLSAVPNPQVWYTGTAGNPQSTQLAAVRRRGMAGGDPSLVYMEWSVDEESYDPADVDDWAKANPALGIRITEDYVARERSALSAEGFAAERLGVGDWPSEGETGVIPLEVWRGCADPRGDRPVDPVCFAIDVNVERSAAAVAVAGRRADGLVAVELADHRSGLEWLVARVVELDSTWHPVGVVVDVGGPAATFVRELEDAGVTVIPIKFSEVAQAAEGLYDAVIAGTLRHMADGRLDAAVAGAKAKTYGDAWAWARRTSAVDVSPLVAASFALWGYLENCDGELGPDDITILSF